MAICRHFRPGAGIGCHAHKPSDEPKFAAFLTERFKVLVTYWVHFSFRGTIRQTAVVAARIANPPSTTQKASPPPTAAIVPEAETLPAAREDVGLLYISHQTFLVLKILSR